MTDSMRMFRAGVEGGRPGAGRDRRRAGMVLQGDGHDPARPTASRCPCRPMPRMAARRRRSPGVYLIDAGGRPRRIGMAMGNEFSDHKFEKKQLPESRRLQDSAPARSARSWWSIRSFESVPGTVTIERAGRVLWSKAIATGEEEMCHSLANIEHHHFKFETHRRPGDVHVHYYGAHSLSFGDGDPAGRRGRDVASVRRLRPGAAQSPAALRPPNRIPIVASPIS